jgi:hypothetical protein
MPGQRPSDVDLPVVTRRLDQETLRLRLYKVESPPTSK